MATFKVGNLQQQINILNKENNSNTQNSRLSLNIYF